MCAPRVGVSSAEACDHRAMLTRSDAQDLDDLLAELHGVPVTYPNLHPNLHAMASATGLS